MGNLSPDKKVVIWIVLTLVTLWLTGHLMITFGTWLEARRIRKMVRRRLERPDMTRYKGFDVDAAERRARRGDR